MTARFIVPIHVPLLGTVLKLVIFVRSMESVDVEVQVCLASAIVVGGRV